ncbi:hypothetical protein ACH5RR_040014 [Cinchona calisaya]|uniref:Reverse transcriptase RNase H-like domain-containing protein n=1 Tax=Cinchona calisaya TaxID=153742 RepID=A0ABD2Y2E8_9GENT
MNGMNCNAEETVIARFVKSRTNLTRWKTSQIHKKSSGEGTFLAWLDELGYRLMASCLNQIGESNYSAYQLPFLLYRNLMIQNHPALHMLDGWMIWEKIEMQQWAAAEGVVSGNDTQQAKKTLRKPAQIDKVHMCSLEVTVQRECHMSTLHSIESKVSQESLPPDLVKIWLAKLMGYDYEITHKKGHDNIVADALTRIPHENLEASLQAVSFLQSDLVNQIKKNWTKDAKLKSILQESNSTFPSTIITLGSKHY